MQGRVTAVLVNWFASWWHGLDDPNIIKILSAGREGLNNAFPFDVLYHCPGLRKFNKRKIIKNVSKV